MNSILLPVLLSLVTSGEPQQMSGILPEKCPDPSVVASQTINYVAPLPTLMGGNEFWWIGVIENASYGTNENWTLLLVNMTKKKNGRAVLKDMTRGLHSLDYLDGKNVPQWDDGLGATVCGYRNTNENLAAVAIYPPLY